MENWHPNQFSHQSNILQRQFIDIIHYDDDKTGF